MTHTETGSGSECAYGATAQQVQKFVSTGPFNIYPHTCGSERERCIHTYICESDRKQKQKLMEIF